MNQTSSITALISAFGRAYHQEQEKSRVFEDTVARKLMTDSEYRMICSYILSGIDFFAPDKKGKFASEEEALRYLVNTQIAPTPLARARFCEECLKTAIRTGTKQYVILGAGLDTFAFREPEFLKKYSVFEVDHPLTQADKKERIHRAGFSIPDRLHFVSVDFTSDSLGAELQKAGFDTREKTFFSLLGVSYYLSADQIDTLLAGLASISADGSSLVFDYADEGLFTSDVRRVQNMIAMAAAGGEPMKSCFEYTDLEKRLEKHRFLIYEFLNPTDIQERYFLETDGRLSSFEHINYITAVFKEKI